MDPARWFNILSGSVWYREASVESGTCGSWGTLKAHISSTPSKLFLLVSVNIPFSLHIWRNSKILLDHPGMTIQMDHLGCFRNLSRDPQGTSATLLSIAPGKNWFSVWASPMRAGRLAGRVSSVLCCFYCLSNILSIDCWCYECSVAQKYGFKSWKMQLKTWEGEKMLKWAKGCKTTGKSKHYFLTLDVNLNKNGVQGLLWRIKEIRWLTGKNKNKD